MHTTRGALFTALLAVAGLLVSLNAVWPRLGPGENLQDSEPGLPAVYTLPVPAPATGRSGLVVETPAQLSPKVARASAKLRRAKARAVARPVRLRAPGVGINTRVRPVGVAKDGQMQLPVNPKVLGWYRYGAAPGSRSEGSVVLAGHLDTLRLGLGPLVRLRESSVGDRIVLTQSDGTVQRYTVRALRRFPRDRLPAVVFSREGGERLHLITCGGAFDANRGGYQQNLVVTAVPD